MSGKTNRNICPLVRDHVAFGFDDYPKGAKAVSQHFYQFIPATLFGLRGIDPSVAVYVPKALVNVCVRKCDLLLDICQLIQKKSMQVRDGCRNIPNRIGGRDS